MDKEANKTVDCSKKWVKNNKKVGVTETKKINGMVTGHHNLVLLIHLIK